METQINDLMDRRISSVERFIPPSQQFAKRAARRLQKAHYMVTGAAIKLSFAQELLSRIYGHADWFSLGQAMERDGTSTSLFDSALDTAQRKLRFNEQIDLLGTTLGLFPGDASRLIVYANPTDSAKSISQNSGAADTSGTHVGLPRAVPRPGLQEILFTAHTFALYYKRLPLPGWQQFALIAAPMDNSAIWVRFCDPDNVAEEAKNLIHSIKELSAGSLQKAYVSSNVRNQFPGLEEAFSDVGIDPVGGRPAIMAARLYDRLSSAFAHAAIEMASKDPMPTIVELRRIFHFKDGLVEIPDAKNLGEARYHDFRAMDFSIQMVHLIREHRWEDVDKPATADQRANTASSKHSDTRDAGDVTFSSAVRIIPVGLPVYRIRIELPLVDYDGLEEVRRITISRVIEVPPYYDLWDLHIAIQDAMGWSDYHLHQFTFVNPKSGKKSQTFSSPNEDDPDEPTSANERLANHVVSMAAHSAEYLYDFGDGWKHQLTLVGTVPSDGGGYPRCVEGEFACPPEDCGSDGGYFRVIDVMSGKRQSYAGEQKETAEWLKGHPNVDWPYRPNHFEPSKVWFDDPQERWDYAYGS